MIAYFDTSAVAKFFARDEGAATEVDRIWSGSERVLSSSIILAEAHAALAAMERARRLSGRRALQAARVLGARLAAISTIPADDAVCSLAGKLARTHALRSADAIHLASALRTGLRLTVVSWDHRFISAARDAGLSTAGV